MRFPTAPAWLRGAALCFCKHISIEVEAISLVCTTKEDATAEFSLRTCANLKHRHDGVGFTSLYPEQSGSEL